MVGHWLPPENFSLSATCFLHEMKGLRLLSWHFHAEAQTGYCLRLWSLEDDKGQLHTTYLEDLGELRNECFGTGSAKGWVWGAELENKEKNVCMKKILGIDCKYGKTIFEICWIPERNDIRWMVLEMFYYCEQKQNSFLEGCVSVRVGSEKQNKPLK